MTAEDVIAFYSLLERLGVEIWIDGGWGVDALLVSIFPKSTKHSVIPPLDDRTVIGST